MQALRQDGSPEALEAEILFCELQGRRLAKEEGIQAEKICIYCGFQAEAVDHVIPVARQQWSRRCSHGPCVDSCSSCNGLLSSHVFHTFRLRLEFLRGKYERRRRFLSDLWDEEELSEFGPTLTRYIRGGIMKDRCVEAKLWWLDRMIRLLVNSAK